MGVISRVRSRVRDALNEPDTAPAMRRFLVNTIFDCTFVIIGILIASVFTGEPDQRLVIVTIVTSSVALGISTGISVFEAETMEQTIRLKGMEKALLVSLEDTHLHRTSRTTILLIASVNFTAPIITGIIAVTPFLLLGSSNIRLAGYISLILAIAILFIVGVFIGRAVGRRPLVQGARMAIAGVAAFILCFLIESLI